MVQKQIPAYFGFRIYFTSVTLFFFLVIPFIGFIVYQNAPTFLQKHADPVNRALTLKDSLATSLDSISRMNETEVDSLVNRAIQLGESYQDSLSETSDNLILNGPQSENEGGSQMFREKGPFARYFSLLFLLLIVSDVAGYLYNRPFKRYFRLKRRKKEIPERLRTYCRKRLLQTPVINSLIVTMPNLVVLIYSLVSLTGKATVGGELERSMFIQLLYLTLVATILEILFVFYWQKHRVHISYIDHIYSANELRRQVFKRKGGKIRNRLLVASGMTTFLPLLIVIVYLVMSLSAVKDLKYENFSRQQREILIGSWVTVSNTDKATVPAGKYKKMFYVNAIDSMVMLVGIGSGILVSFIYLLLFIRWTNLDITRPVKELLTSIRNTRAGELEQYTIVRTHDEIGELAEGYNEMTGKIHDYVESISSMNRELEEKVKARTQEVVMQKEEIEAQKEEIEAQLDMTTIQRDTISKQKELILDSIRYAERIQSAILPPATLLKDHLSGHFILFKPRDIVSGDYYWTTLQHGKLYIAVADCTGHGVPGAFLSMLGISSMNEIVSRSENLSPGKILEQLRDIVTSSLHQSGTKGETQDGIEIALCVLDLQLKVLEFAGANRPLYHIRGETLQHIRPDRMPIGIYEQEPSPFTNHQISLMEGDTIYLFSDGYVDQLGGPLRKTFRAGNFRKLLLEIQELSMAEQKEVLLKKLKVWQGEIEQIDDILVMGIRI